MSWTYASPLAGGHHVVRFLIGDTVERTPLLEDEEILYLLGVTPNPLRAASRACLAIAAKLSQEAAITVKGEVQIGLGKRAEAFVARSKELEREMLGTALPYAGGLSWSEKEAARADTDKVQPIFRDDQGSYPGTHRWRGEEYE